jgi:Zn-dependent M28 family amino/carboxypeptidase
MVLFDMVGDCDLRIPREASSDPALYRLFRRSAGPDSPFRGRSGAILDDQTPFERAGVPSVDLIDFDYGPGPSPGAYWHSRRDDLSHVCARSLGQVGRPALTALGSLGALYQRR